MTVIQSSLLQLSEWISPYNTQVAMTIIATLLVVYGDLLNKYIKQRIKPYPFIVRTLMFVFICAFGYGLLLVFLTPYAAKALLLIAPVYRGVSIVGVFLLLGYLAENRRYI